MDARSSKPSLLSVSFGDKCVMPLNLNLLPDISWWVVCMSVVSTYMVSSANEEGEYKQVAVVPCRAKGLSCDLRYTNTNHSYGVYRDIIKGNVDC